MVGGQCPLRGGAIDYTRAVKPYSHAREVLLAGEPSTANQAVRAESIAAQNFDDFDDFDVLAFDSSVYLFTRLSVTTNGGHCYSSTYFKRRHDVQTSSCSPLACAQVPCINAANAAAAMRELQ